MTWASACPAPGGAALWILTAACLVLGAGCRKADPEASPPNGATATAGRGLPSQPVEVISKSGIAMIFLPGGSFVMGSSRGNPDEGPPHKVEVSPFLIDVYEVTHELFTKVQLPNPSHWQDSPKKPVERVRWRDAKEFCNERSLLEGLKPCYDEKTPDWGCDFSANGYRLPTEAEWEYACRAGSTDAYDFGSPDKLRQFAWLGENADQKTHAVGQKKPNRWGLHDLYGNVSEWCEDVYSSTYYRESPTRDPRGPASPGKDVKRVIRGGSWKASPDMCRASFRQGERTGDTDACFLTDYCGFRCVRRVTPAELQELRAQGR